MSHKAIQPTFIMSVVSLYGTLILLISMVVFRLTRALHGHNGHWSVRELDPHVLVSDMMQLRFV